MSLDRLLPLLRCPLNGDALERRGRWLVSQSGETYPIVADGLPVLLARPPDDPTVWVVKDSYEAARAYPDDPFQIPTIQTTIPLRRRAREMLAAGGYGPVDPVIQCLVASTGGHMYRRLVGALPEVPIPELRLPEGRGRFLDIGCSWGRWSIAAARKGYSVVGIDPCLGAVMAARRLATAMGLDIDFIVADALRLPFAAESFHQIFSYSVLQHFSYAHAEQALRESARVARPGAGLLAQMPNRFGVRSLQHQARRGFRAARSFDVRYYSPRRLLETFTAAFGPSRLSIDGFFGLGIQPADRRLMSLAGRLVIDLSELLRAGARAFPPLLWLADSLYVSSRRPD